MEQELFRDEALTAREAKSNLRSVFRNPLSRKKAAAVPEILQVTSNGCAAACLAMVLSACDRKTSLFEVEAVLKSARDGVSAALIVQAGKFFGVTLLGISVREVAELQFIPLPAILHWNFDHFVVLERWTSTAARIVDPSLGRREVDRKELDQNFTGVALVIDGVTHREQTPAVDTRSERKFAGIDAAGRWTIFKIVLLSFLLHALGLLLPAITKNVVDHVIAQHRPNALLISAAMACGLVSGYFMSSLLRSRLVTFLKTHLEKQTATEFLKRLVELPFSFFQGRAIGDLLIRIQGVGTIQHTLTGTVLAAAVDSCMAVGFLSAMICYQPSLASVALLSGAIQVAIAWFGFRLIYPLTKSEIQAQSRTHSYVVEMMRGIEVIKACGAEGEVLARWQSMYTDELNAQLATQRKGAWVESTQAAARLFAPLTLLLVGAVKVLQNEMSLGTMFGFNLLAAAFLAPLNSMVSALQGFRRAQIELERIKDIWMHPAEQGDRQAKIATTLQGSITADSLCFRYSPIGPTVLQGVNLTIKAGQIVAIVGRSGAGKSTLARLLIGMYEPTDGEIRFDGIPLSAFSLQGLRQQIGVVTQGSFLLNDTIRQNIAFCNKGLSSEGISGAAEIAQIRSDIEKMPLGFDTVIAEMGSNVSGGQRQRLAIARAVAGAPRILLLDEATSELDLQTERRVLEGIAKLRCTRIVITHRLQAIKHADVIIVLDEGRAVQSGTHEELMSKSPLYRELVAQPSDEEHFSLR